MIRKARPPARRGGLLAAVLRPRVLAVVLLGLAGFTAMPTLVYLATRTADPAAAVARPREHDPRIPIPDFPAAPSQAVPRAEPRAEPTGPPPPSSRDFPVRDDKAVSPAPRPKTSYRPPAPAEPVPPRRKPPPPPPVQPVQPWNPNREMPPAVAPRRAAPPPFLAPTAAPAVGGPDALNPPDVPLGSAGTRTWAKPWPKGLSLVEVHRENSSYRVPRRLSTLSNNSPGARPFRILFVSEVEVYLTSMSRWFFHMYEAMRQLPGVEAYLWGPGFPDYDDNLSVASNAAKRWGKATYFDFFFNHTIHHNPQRRWVGNGADAPPVAVWHHECMLFEKLPTIDHTKVFACSHEANVIFHAYANHMAYYADRSVGDKLLWHLPHAAHAPLFGPSNPPHSARQIDILVVGNIWSVYPLRVRFLKLYDERRLPGRVFRMVHPGYWLDSNTTDAAVAENQAQAYTQALQSAKIVLVCSSKRNYAVRKYVEAAAAGALVIGDIPGEREAEFRSYVVEVKHTDPDDVIIRTIRWWLDHSAERESRAASGESLVTSHYLTVHAAENALMAMQSYILGQRGMHFPHEFDIPDMYMPQTRPCLRSLQQLKFPRETVYTKSKL